MKFKINKNIFLSGLQKTQGITDKKSTMPILSNLLLKAKENSIEITATDLEVGIRDIIEALVLEEGGITIGARKLYEIVKELPEEECLVSTSETKEGWLEVKSGKARFNIVGLMEEEYPALPSYSEDDFSFIDSQTLQKMLEKTAFSVSTDETRYNINGVFFEKESESVDTVKMVSTDGHRLSLIEKKGIEIKQLKEGIIIPKKGVNELKKLLSEEENLKIGIDITGSNVIFKTNNTVLTVRLLEGAFPDYRQILPKANAQSLYVDRQSFLSALKRVSILSLERSKGIKLAISKSRMVVSTSNPDLGEAEEDVEVEYNGEDLSIGFNARYLIEPLGVIEETQVSMEFKDALSPAVIKPFNSKEYMCVIMPMRL